MFLTPEKLEVDGDPAWDGVCLRSYRADDRADRSNPGGGLEVDPPVDPRPAKQVDVSFGKSRKLSP